LCPSYVAEFPDRGAMFGGILGVLLVGGLYVSVGLCMSTLTSNQIVAAISSIALLFGATLVLAFMASNSQSMAVRIVGQYYSSFVHMMDFARGVVDSRMVLMYVSNTAWFLFASTKVVESRRA